MRIEKYANTTEKEVKDKNFNIWLGISLGNKYFDKKNLKKYINWSLENTRQEILIVIADSLHAINHEILDNKTPKAALKKALKNGEKKYKETTDVVKGLPKEKVEKINVVRWDNVIQNTNYQNNERIIKKEFKENKIFHDYIIKIVKDGRKDRKDKLEKLSQEKLDRLAEYILGELPFFVNGIEYENIIYTLIPYPGFTMLDELFIGIQNKTMFPELAKKLKITNKIQVLEAYID